MTFICILPTQSAFWSCMNPKSWIICYGLRCSNSIALMRRVVAMICLDHVTVMLRSLKAHIIWKRYLLASCLKLCSFTTKKAWRWCWRKALINYLYCLLIYIVYHNISRYKQDLVCRSIHWAGLKWRKGSGAAFVAPRHLSDDLVQCSRARENAERNHSQSLAQTTFRSGAEGFSGQQTKPWRPSTTSVLLTCANQEFQRPELHSAILLLGSLEQICLSPAEMPVGCAHESPCKILCQT